MKSRSSLGDRMFRKAAALALLAGLAGTARAGTYNYTGSLQTDTITQSGLYQITGYGAAGGASAGAGGGLGAGAGGEIMLTAGTTLDIVVGGAGGFVSGTTFLKGGVQSGNGVVTVNLITASVPEPSTLIQAGTAFLAGLGYSWRRRLRLRRAGGGGN